MPSAHDGVQVVHGSYMPLTPRKQRGYFDIAVRRDSGEPDDGLGSTLRDKEFSRFLDSLPLGTLTFASERLTVVGSCRRSVSYFRS